MATIDVGIVTYNTRDLTVDAIRRLVEATPDVDFRVLVHDNASTDGTAEAIQSAHPAVEVEAGDRNLGFGAGMNRLIARSTAPWFLCLNSDAWPDPGAVATLLAAGEADPRVGAVAPRLEQPDGTLEHSVYPFPSVKVAAVTAVGGYRRLLPPHDVAGHVDWVVGAAVLMRRAALDDVGGFDESFFMYAEDLEWCWRLHRGGWLLHFEPDAVIRHVANASGRKVFGDRRTRAHTLNSNRFYRRVHGPVNTAAYRALCLGGYGRLYLSARLRRDDGARAEWANHLRAHLSRVPDRDGPPPERAVP